MARNDKGGGGVSTTLRTHASIEVAHFVWNGFRTMGFLTQQSSETGHFFLHDSRCVPTGGHAIFRRHPVRWHFSFFSKSVFWERSSYAPELRGSIKKKSGAPLSNHASITSMRGRAREAPLSLR